MATTLNTTKQLAVRRSQLESELMAGSNISEARRRVLERRREALINEAVQLNRGLLAKHVNSWVRSTDITKDSIEAAGLAGLTEAVIKYDPARGIFSSFAMRYIKHAVGEVVRVELFPLLTNHAFTVRPKVIDLDRHNYTPAEIASELGVGIDTVKAILAARVVPYDVDAHENSNACSDVYSSLSPYSDLNLALTSLTGNERYLVEQRLGFTGPPRTTTDLSKELGVTPQAVSKRMQAISKKLRAELRTLNREVVTP